MNVDIHAIGTALAAAASGEVGTWQAVGTALAGLIIGGGGVGLWWRKQVVETARQGAEVDVIQMLRAEVERLAVRQAAMEKREGRLIRHVYKLEALLHAQGLAFPPFTVEDDPHQVRRTSDPI